MSEPTCSTCRFWFRCDGLSAENECVPGLESVGYCRRYPPGPSPVLNTDTPMDTTAWANPATWDSHWCGEHQPRP